MKQKITVIFKIRNSTITIVDLFDFPMEKDKEVFVGKFNFEGKQIDFTMFIESVPQVNDKDLISFIK